MPAVYSTIAQASSARRRTDNLPKTAPLTTEQRNEKRDARSEKQAQIDAHVQEWMQYTNDLATKLADKFDMKPRYFLDIFFQGGAHMINHQNHTNPYNAFKSVKATEAREQGLAKNGGDLHKEHYTEYLALTSEEKKEMVKTFDKTKDQNFHLRRDTPRGRVQDVANVVRNMKMLLFGAGQRVGLEGFFCVVRNNVDFKMDPEWYFTSKELENYMPIVTQKKWVTGEVGMKLEAFAIAGCDPANMLRTAHQKANFMKGEIRQLLTKNLVEVSKVETARIGWTWFEEDVVQRYGVDLKGWTAGRIVDPSNLSTSQSVIRKLLEAVRDGTCVFVKLGTAEAAARKEQWEADVAAGRVEAKHRARRSDAGVPRKRARTENDENEPPAGSDEEDEDADADTAPPAKKKRARAGADASKPKKASKKTAAAGKKGAATVREPLTRRKAISREIIDSGDEMDADPDANEGGDEGPEGPTAGSSALIVYTPPVVS
ncbi:hypothetical protein R3P38DRAFT_2502945 [Favolaschia claudopus]|uniref:Uncharacterized protein n=1 Tax=Favolaschia claudopus TaxID=2862362 RepID=A0AAW0DPV1_9AGAR